MSGSQGSQARGTFSSSAVSKILKGEYDVLVILCCLSGLYKVYWTGVWKWFLQQTRRYHSITLDLWSEGPRFDTCSDLFADFSVQIETSSETKVKIWKYLPPPAPPICQEGVKVYVLCVDSHYYYHPIIGDGICLVVHTVSGEQM